jgi:tight adherence protein B
MIVVYQILLALGTVVVAMLAYAGFRKLQQEQQKRRQRRLGLSEQSDVLVKKVPAAPSSGVAGRIDTGFERLVHQTGLEVQPEQILAGMALLGVVVAGGLYLWRGQLSMVLVGLVVGIGTPLVILWFLRGRYQGKLLQQLPDALYLIARSLRAGTSLEQAINLVAEDGPKPLAGEFKRCAASMQLGLTVTVSLQMMAQRVNLVDFNAFVSSVAFHQTTGGNLPLLLDRLAAGARDRNQFRGQFWAATAQGRITAIALALAAPALVLGYVIFQPDFAQAFLHDPSGWAFLGVVAILEVIGVVWVTRILKIDY